MLKNILYFFVCKFFIVALRKLICFVGYLFNNVQSFNYII